MKRWLLLILVSLIYTIGVAQENLVIIKDPQVDAKLEVPRQDSVKLMDFSMNAGMSAFTTFKGMYGFDTYVAPQWSFMASKKFQVDVSPWIGRTSYYNLPVWSLSDGTKLKLDQNFSRIGMAVQGTYLINEKWYSGGEVFLDMNMPDNSPANLNSFTNYGANAFVGYKFSDHFSVEASFGVSKYPTYSNFNPVMNPYRPLNPYDRW